MKKRMLAVLMCLCLCLGLFPAAAVASEEPMVSVAADEAEVPVSLEIPELAEFAEVPDSQPVLDGDEQLPETYSVSFSDNLGPDGSVLVAVNSNDFAVMTDENSLTLSTEDVVYLKANPEEEYAIARVLTIVGAGEEVQGFASVVKQDGIYTLTGCSMSCSIRIEFDTSSSGDSSAPGESGGASGEPGASDEPVVVDPYTITLDITYPEGYEKDDGGIEMGTTPANPTAVVLKGDGTVSEEYEEAKSFTVLNLPGLVAESVTVKCACAEECSHVGQSPRPDGVVDYTISGTVTVTIVYAEIDYSTITVTLQQPEEGDVGMFSALLTAKYELPSYMDHDIRIFYSCVDGGSDGASTEMNSYSNYTRSVHLVRDESGAYVYEEEVNELLPGTTYYARAVLVLQEETLVSDAIQFTTDAGTCPAVTVAPVEGTYTEDTIPCTVNGKQEDITFTATDGYEGSDGVSYVSMVKLNVTEDGVYRFVLDYPETTGEHDEVLICRLYTLDEKGELQEVDGSVEDTIAWFPLSGSTSEQHHTTADIRLSKDTTYYLALDADAGAGRGTVSVAMLNDHKPVEFSITAKQPHYGTDDGKPHAVRAMVDYSVSGYYDNGYRLAVYYDLKSAYEETGEMRYSTPDMPAIHQAEDGREERVRLERCIDGLEYVYYAQIVDKKTGEVLAESEVIAFQVDMTSPRSLWLGENRNTAENRIPGPDGMPIQYYAFGMSGALTYSFRTGDAGRYLFNANNQNAVIEIYDGEGSLLAKSTAAERWASVSVELNADTTYYIYIENVYSITPIVTVSYLLGDIAVDTPALEVDESGADIARDTLETTINDLTKNDEGEAVELPSYVETDEAGEAALREAIETGDSITAEVTGTELTEEEVDASVAEAMEKAALVAADTETAEVLLYLDLSVLLTLEDEEIAKLTETEEEIAFQIPITDELAQAIAGKVLYVVRYHEGGAETIEVEISQEDGYIYFSSKLFSTYGLYAADKPASAPTVSDDGDIPDTGDEAPILLWSVMLLFLAEAMVLVLGRKNRKTN